jgi:hypothetical protein
MTELALTSMWTRWLTSFIRPNAAVNAVIASSTGSTAASSAPNATSRMPSASGAAVHSARRKSRPTSSSKARCAVASPNSSRLTSGCASPVLATAASTGCTRLPAVRALPTMSNRTSTSCRSAETIPVAYGSRTPVTWPVSRSPVTRVPTAVRNPAASAVSVRCA